MADSAPSLAEASFPPSVPSGDISPDGPDGADKTWRILLVDDNAAACHSLSLLLTMDGHQVAIAASGTAALEAARSSPPEIVLLDISLPDIDGYKVARLLRRELAHIKLVALTGSGHAEDRERSLCAGFDEHLVKPVSRRLLTKVLTLLAHRPPGAVHSAHRPPQ